MHSVVIGNLCWKAESNASKQWKNHMPVRNQTGNLVSQEYTESRELFASSGLPVIFCLIALNMCIARAKCDRSSMVGVPIWPELPDNKGVE